MHGGLARSGGRGMNLRNRQRLLSIARYLDRCALRIRKYVREQTPRRKRIERQEQVS